MADRPLPAADPARIVYFGGYDRGAGRNHILMAGLRAAGAEVLECAAPLWRSTEDKLAAAGAGPAALAALLPRLAWSWATLLRRHARLPAYQAMVVGATAHLDLPLATRLARRRGAALVFDPLVSATETLEDRDILTAGSGRLAAVAALERRLWRLPGGILADTAAHADAWSTALRLERARMAVLPVGSIALGDGPPKTARTPSVAAPLRVLYFGQYIPLHGVEVILAAADRLRDNAAIRFQLVGRGQTLDAARRMAVRLQLPNVEIHPLWLPLEQLYRRFILPADLCLGIFGDRPKAARVVPYKVYAALAAGRPVVSADSPALRELLLPGREIHAVPPDDAAALAAAVLGLAEHPDRRLALARAGHEAWRRRFNPAVLGGRLLDLLADGFGRVESR